MSLAVFIPTEHSSRYSLLGTFARELADAFARTGCHVNPTGPVMAQGAVHLFLNTPERLESLRAWAGVGDDGQVRARTAAVQYFVDHPLALDAAQLDEMSAWPHFRLLMPCLDDTHLLRLRFPKLRHVRCAHGVPEWSLCDEATLEEGHATGRELGVLATGTIHTRAELVKLREALPAALREAADEVVRFQAEHPLASFGQACELCLPTGVFASDHWRLLQMIWRYTTATLNRTRRLAMVRAMQGVTTAVIGPEAWREVCTGTIEYHGPAAYAELPTWFARARVCLAWGPTQFVHSYSERVLLAMAGGCACVADDRVMARRELGDACAWFDGASPEAARAEVDRLMGDGAARLELAATGRLAVEKGHLWRHRIETIVAVAVDAMRMETA